MTAKNFVNFHILISHSPSCLNRDDMNMQKTAIFGGKNRVRISSQSLKRALRFSDYYKTHFGAASTRTRELEKLIPIFTDLLKDEFGPSLVAKTMELFVRATASVEEVDEGVEANDQDESGDNRVGAVKKLAVAPWSLDEIRVLCGIVKDVSLTGDETEKAIGKAAKQKGKKKKTEQEVIEEELTKKRIKTVKDKIEQVRVAIGKATDIALSGRMATSGLMTSVDGALAVAHAITTHTVEPQDVDWFTAVDDLTQDAGETGAGHLNTQQFSAGVFYRYASLNLKQLQVNLGLLADMEAQETPESRARALEIARHVLHLLATVVPSAKQQTFAAHNLCDLALVSFSAVPVSLANAFEAPVTAKTAGYLVPSVAALVDYWAGTHAFHGLDEQAAVAAMNDFDCPARLARKPSLAELEHWVEQGGNA